MLDKAHILSHARSAVEGAARSLSDMRTRLTAPELSRPHRLSIDETMLGLGRRHGTLVNLYDEMLVAQDSELPMYWQRFVLCYDDYLDAVRDARCRLVREIQCLPRSQDRAVARTYPNRSTSIHASLPERPETAFVRDRG